MSREKNDKNFYLYAIFLLHLYFECYTIHTVPVWRNGRRYRLKICCPTGRGGSSPSTGTSYFSYKIFRYFFSKIVILTVERVFDISWTAINSRPIAKRYK